MCLANAVLIAGSATPAGGFAALAIRRFGMKNAVVDHSAPTPSSFIEKKSGAGEITLNSH
jgi:2-polyprenyl-6-methoxyphenol hydroxylase-like FAD-dependent oxidoreductase